MKIKCFARDFVETDITFSNTVLISINNYKQTNLKNKYLDCLYLNFDDITFKKHPYKIFNKTHFNQIMYFISKHKGKDIHVNCTAGISRSGAVALGIALAYNNEELFWDIVKNNHILPNEYILSYFQLKFKRYWFSYFNLYRFLNNKNKPQHLDVLFKED